MKGLNRSICFICYDFSPAGAIPLTLACSKRSDSGERCEVKKVMKSREREIISENKVICLCVFSLYHLSIFIRFTKKIFLLAYFFVKSERQRELMSLSYVCHGKEFRSLTSHPKLVYSMKTCS